MVLQTFLILTPINEIFPNPSTDLLTIKSNIKKELNFEIFSSFGKIVMTGNLNNNDVINLSKLEPQVYILKIDGNSYKLIKK